MKNETEKEKESRIFNFYKKDLEKLSKEHGSLRFICVEYVCSFPNIDPFKMATAIASDNVEILFDDSSISKADNLKKERKFARMTA